MTKSGWEPEKYKQFMYSYLPFKTIYLLLKYYFNK